MLIFDKWPKLRARGQKVELRKSEAKALRIGHFLHWLSLLKR